MSNSEKFSDSNTLETYLNSFGFYPDPVTVSEKTGLDRLAKLIYSV